MKTRKLHKASGLIGIFALSLISQAVAATIPFSTSPAGNGGKPPAPNLIITLDNSGSMGTAGITALRTALTQAFSADNVPADSIRLGWNLFNADARGVSCIDFSTTNCAGNAIQVFTETRRTNFINWVNNPNNSMSTPYITPTHRAYMRALSQFDIQPSDIRSPWAEKPNQQVGQFLACRKSYVMLMTDGGYNSDYNTPITLNNSTNLDSVRRTLPDNTDYDPASNDALSIYRDQDTPGFNTISDLAFHYWAKDLVTGNENNQIKPTINVSGNLTLPSSTLGRDITIPEYWNPVNNPATWQHVVTHTIGFNNAASWPATGSVRLQSGMQSINLPAFDGSPAFPNGYNQLLSGDVTWPRLYLESSLVRPNDGDNVTQRKRTEMWHAAINSRGNFYPARTAQDLVNAVRDIIQNVTQDTSQRIASAAGSSLSARVDSFNYYTEYDAEKWSGNVRIQPVAARGSATPPASPWGSNTVASLLNDKDIDTRNILTSGTTAGTLTAYPFVWANLNNDQKSAFNANNLGEARVQYLRGDRSLEGAGGLRERASVLGDIVNSKIWFMRGKPNAGYISSDYLSFARSKDSRGDVLFVGANDGMLHAFSASNGQELFAYVPQGAYANLANYTAPNYAHRYFVDGSPFTSDFKDGSTWKTALAGFMGAGSKGYFLLDVTDPSGVTSTSVLADTTATADRDIGHIFQSPVPERDNPMISRQITRLNNNEWALVTGNGYNSTDEKAVLLIHFLTGSNAGTVKKIEATNTVGAGNGLSAPRLIDMNGDFVPDVVYAGDLQGNLWKFDIAGTNASSWGLASTTPMLRARNSTGQVQPITTAPIYTAHPEGGVMVVVGTGQNLTDGDRLNTQVQSFYGVRDENFNLTSSSRGGIEVTGAPSVLNRTELTQQTASSRADSVGVDNDTTFWTQSDNTVDYASKKGWFLDLPFTGERALDHPTWFEGTVIDLNGRIPANGTHTNEETCDAAVTPEEFITRMVDAVSGGRPKTPPFGPLFASGGNYPTVTSGSGPRVPRNSDDKQDQKCVGDNCKDGPTRNFSAQALVPPSWRQME